MAQSDAATYLGGILWNLETYQNGYCADYGYNYGRRLSPTPFEVSSHVKVRCIPGVWF